MERDSRQGAARPPDHGLAALGLIMQLGGSIFLVLTVIELLSIYRPGLVDADSSWLMNFKVLPAAAVIRSALHVRAGRALTRRSGPARLHPTYTYIAVAFAQTALTLGFLSFAMGPWDHEVSIRMVVAAVVLLAWPVTLLGMTIDPRLRRSVRGEQTHAANEVPGALMVVLGMIGVLAAIFMSYAVLGPGDVRVLGSSSVRLLIFYVCALLMGRSVLHVIAGARVMSGGDPAATDRAMTRYLRFGLLSSVLTGIALVVVHALDSRGSASSRMYTHVTDAWALGVLLLVWPLLLRPLDTARRSSPARLLGGGLAGLGWFLLALGVLQLALAVLVALVGFHEDYPSMHFWLRGVTVDWTSVVDHLRWPWWMAVIAPVQMWAGIELIHSTRRQGTAVTAYGCLSTVITMYLLGPQLLRLSEMLTLEVDFRTRVASLFQIAFWLVVPLMTMVLANRRPAATPSSRSKVDEGAGEESGA
jgi:hypothetical protein